MKTSQLHILFAFILLSLVIGNLAIAEGDSIIDAASSAYESGDFAKASRDFETALASGDKSFGLYYNLAMSQKKEGQAGNAALNLRRAILLEPRNVDARVALSDIERSKGIPMPASDWKAKFAEHLPLLPFLVCGFVLFWAGAFLGLFGAFQNQGYGRLVSGVLVAVAGAAIFSAAYVSDPRFAWRESSIVTSSEGVALLKSPAERSEAVAKLPSGSMVRIVRINGEWAYAKLPDGKSGWLLAGGLTRLVPGL
jgi:tetratricopeptide (TPR) repeat protein